MAELEVKLNTETQVLSVIVDGVPVENAKYVSLSNWGSYYDGGSDRLHFSVNTEEKVGDVSKCTTLFASKKEHTTASTKHKGLFEKEEATASVASSFDFKKFIPVPAK